MVVVRSPVKQGINEFDPSLGAIPPTKYDSPFIFPMRCSIIADEELQSIHIYLPSCFVRSEGFMSLYKGLSAGLTRQVVYTGVRGRLWASFARNNEAQGSARERWSSQEDSIECTIKGLTFFHKVYVKSSCLRNCLIMSL